jgi:transposase InsO family protein
MGRIAVHDDPATAAADDIRSLSFRNAKKKYHVGYKTWRAIKTWKTHHWTPSTGGKPVPQNTLDAILESVRVAPHWNTCERAHQLRIRVETCQRVLRSHALNRSTPRLRFAGYQVEDVPPLASARLRRVVALAPAIYSSCDFKTFGVVSGNKDQAERRLCGCQLIDQLTAYATVCLGESHTTELAARTLVTHAQAVRDRFGAKLTGLILTDNALEFGSAAWLEACQRFGLTIRTTKYAHPWSNGKAEALNKTLKFQCFPAILTGAFYSIPSIEQALKGWLLWYNEKRMHTGRINKGLPPAVLWDLWQKTSGTPWDKLISLNIIRPEDLPFCRILGCDQRGEKLAPRPLHDPRGVPYAIVIDRSDAESRFQPLTSREASAKIRYYAVESSRRPRSNVILKR